MGLALPDVGLMASAKCRQQASLSAGNLLVVQDFPVSFLVNCPKLLCNYDFLIPQPLADSRCPITYWVRNPSRIPVFRLLTVHLRETSTN